MARDICGGDPETMNPEKLVNYITKEIGFKTVQHEVIKINDADYPLVAAVNRASKSKRFISVHQVTFKMRIYSKPR